MEKPNDQHYYISTKYIGSKRGFEVIYNNTTVVIIIILIIICKARSLQTRFAAERLEKEKRIKKCYPLRCYHYK